MPRKVMRCGVGQVRIKRHKDTFFVVLDVTNGAKVGELREKAAVMMDIEPHQLRLCCPPQENEADVRYFDNDEKLIDLGLANDGVVCAAVMDDNGTWESPVVTPFPVRRGAASSQARRRV